MLDETEIVSITGYGYSVNWYRRFLALEYKTKINNLKEEKCFQNIPLVIFLVWPRMKLFHWEVKKCQNICI